MVYVGGDRQTLYECLRRLDGDISEVELRLKLGWSQDKLFFVCSGITKSFKDRHRELLVDLKLSDLFKPDIDRALLVNHFGDSLIDMGLLLEHKIVELKKNDRNRNPVWLGYRKLWLMYRGY